MSTTKTPQNDNQNSGKTYKTEAKYERRDKTALDFYAKARDLSRIISDLPGSPCGTIKAHMKRQKMTIEHLANESGVSEATIKRIRSDPDYVPEKTTAFAICIALKLEPILQRDWMRKLGIAWSVNSSDIFYELLLEHYYSEPISVVNYHLKHAGFQPL